MQTKNFKGQDLRGRSFKNQDLTGADFSDCDLRGVDFSFANLTDAKFCNVKTGRTLKGTFVLFVLQVLLGGAAGFFASLGNIVFAWSVNEFLKQLATTTGKYLLSIMFVYALLITLVTVVVVNCKRLDYFLWLFVLIIAGANADPVAATVGVIGSVVGYIAVATGGSIAIIAAIAVTLAIATAGTEVVPATITIAASVSSIVYIVFGIYLGRRATNKEESQLLLLRGFLLKMNCLNGTQFAFASLQQTDFSAADLKYARLKNAKISNCNFHNTKNHHLALTENTPLEPRKVRDLVIDGIITDKNFATLDLRGLDFSNLNLQDFDFSHANLSGANLSHTQLTGATLEGWNIDTETRLDDIDCRYYYYLENGAKKRMPPEGEEYGAGEFTRIFQKIANTIDFIAHNEMELAAIKLSVEQVRVESGNDDIRVQAIEEKDGFIVVKVTVPKTEDRGVLYHQINTLKQKIQLLTMQSKEKVIGYEARITDLKEQLDKNRNAVTVTIKDSIINNDGIMNLGKVNGNISQQNTP